MLDFYRQRSKEMEIQQGAITNSKKSFLHLLQSSLEKTTSLSTCESILYIGYPLLKRADGKRTVDSLLISINHHVIAFDIIDNSNRLDLSQCISRQDSLFNLLDAKFKGYPELTGRRTLNFNITIITLDINKMVEGKEEELEKEFVFQSPNRIQTYLDNIGFEVIDNQKYRRIKSVIQGVSTFKTGASQRLIANQASKGAKIKEVENQIANLDKYQNKAVIETNEGPQRITGLAGTGKTIVLASKAAYLHFQNPDWNICITFFSRALYPYYKKLLDDLYKNLSNGDEPDWSKIHILHAWGSKNEPGLYSSIADKNNVKRMTFSEANASKKSPEQDAFEVVCDNLLLELNQSDCLQIFDLVLIDEAQDLPRSFFELSYLSTNSPHRVVWAYDELQQLNNPDDTVPPPEILFGNNEFGIARYSFKDDPTGPSDDIILNVCYRSPKEVIASAHSLGLGVYYKDQALNKSGPIQMIKEADTWERIGYSINGDYEPGKEVSISRKPSTTPSFLSSAINEDLVIAKTFSNEQHQAEWIAKEIEDNLKNDELTKKDIMIIHAFPYSLKFKTSQIRNLLDQKGIDSHIAGEFDASSFFEDNSVVFSHIFRAKGNEAPMVYIVDCHDLATGRELIKKRNMLFTAITRSKAWVRLTGVGSEMEIIEQEISELKGNNYNLKFLYPTNLDDIRELNRNLTQQEAATRNKYRRSYKQLQRGLIDGEISKDDFTQEELRILKEKLFNK